MNKTLRLVAATVSLGAVLSASAMAQDKPMVQSSPTTGKPVVMVPMTANSTDMYKASWVFRNLDEREVKRFRAAGFDDATIKGAANIAMRTGLDIEYVFRRIRDSGVPLNRIAATYNVSTFVLNEEIPGYGAESISMMAPSSMNTTGSAGSSSMSTPPSRTTTSTTTSTTTTSAASGTVVDAAMSDPDFSTLVTALKAADLADTLKGAGPFTILAPNNAAFAKLPAGALDDLLKPENKEKLRSVLLYHVVSGKVMAADVMGMTNPSTPRSLNGSTLNVKTTAPVMVNDANVVRTDINASNGVIHVIDTVLMPPAAN